MKTLKCLLSAVVVAVGFSLTSQAAYTISKFRINQYYGNDAVLQRGVTLPICGTAEKGKTITVTFNGQTKTTTANIDTKMTADYNEGRWVVEFPAISTAGGSYTLTASDGTKTLTNTGLTVGEVWVVSGQSNAQYPVKAFTKQEGYSVDFASEWLQDANYSNLHFIKPTEGHLEWSHTPDTWKISSSATAGECSAMGFFFAKELLKSMTTQIPVGIVAAATDGSLITQWIPGDTSSKDHYTKMINNYLEPLPPFPVKGVLWYQGESDGMFGFSSDYPARLTTLVTNWREIWNNPTMPFIIVQLPFYGQYGQWSEIRLAQNQVAASVPGVYVMPTLDIGDLAMIHPPKKPELGKRLSEYARKYVYGESGVNPEGPLFKSWEMNPNNDHEVIIRFDVHGSITSKDGQALKGFMINGDYYGQKTKYYEVNVRMIDGSTIGVSPKDSKVNPPYIVRYGCNNMEPTEVNFYDSLGYSARAFSTAGFEASDAPVHEHNWNLTLNGSVLTATCSNSGCTSGTPTFSLADTDTKVYDGQPLELHKSGTDFAALTSSELGLVEYYQNGVKISGLPTEVGTYEARVDVDHNNVVYTLKKTITITAAQENPPEVNPPASGDDPAGAIAASGDTSGATDTKTIQDLIDAAAPTHGTVKLGEGTFYINTQLMVTNGVTLVGQGWEKTIIKQASKATFQTYTRCVTIDGGAKVQGVTLTGGQCYGQWSRSGAGAHIVDGTVSWCCISNNANTALGSARGGGIYIEKGTVDHSIIANNNGGTGVGGGIGGHWDLGKFVGPVVIDTCLFYGNTVKGDGAAIGFTGDAGMNIQIRNTTIADNVATGASGGINCLKYELVNSIVTGNTGSSGEENVAGTSQSTSSNNLVGGDAKFANAAAGNYTLTASSPAKGAGVSYSGLGLDLTGASFANPPSIGCYEYGAGTAPSQPEMRTKVIFYVD